MIAILENIFYATLCMLMLLLILIMVIFVASINCMDTYYAINEEVA